MHRIALALFLAFCHAAHGDTMPLPVDQAQSASVWITPGFVSHHFQRERGFKENNYGLGAQLALSPVNAVNAGTFRNSDDAHSRYLGWLWQPYQLGPARLGLWAGALDGYPRMQNGGWFLAAFPMVSFDYKAVGVNLTVIPSYKDKFHGAIVAQFKLRIWKSE